MSLVSGPWVLGSLVLGPGSGSWGGPRLSAPLGPKVSGRWVLRSLQSLGPRVSGLWIWAFVQSPTAC